MIRISYYKSPLGELILGDYNSELCLCDWLYRSRRSKIDERICKGLGAEYKESSTPLIKYTIQQLEEYFSGSRKDFNVPLHFVGSDFQKKVWKELLNIRYGTTESYAELTGRLGDPLAIRAVAGANGDNAISIIVPCHRIIGSNGKLTGYAGGLATKKKLLRIEGALPNHGQGELFPD